MIILNTHIKMKLQVVKLTTGRSGNIDYGDFAGSNQATPPGYFDRVGDRLTSKQNVGGSYRCRCWCILYRLDIYKR